jgi:nicotinamidase-related amidase
MKALVVVDAQNEFSEKGRRAVPDHAMIFSKILWHVERAREDGEPIAWVQHHNKPHESRAFVPGEWGTELSPGLCPKTESSKEQLFQKEVYGAFSTTNLAEWLQTNGIDEVVLVGFLSHMCLSTSAREALVRGFKVSIDPTATGARDIVHPVLGRQAADEVRRTALLQLADMGAAIVQFDHEGRGPATAVRAREQ